jgi:cell division protein FtsI (penicillin-binding protein 3)
MEIKSGEVKAIANLTRSGKDSSYVENLNYAVGVATVPGSTFKLPSLIAAMEDFDVKLNEVIDIGDGTCFYSNAKVSDSHHPVKSKVSVQEVFEQSSNVGVTKIITRYYSKDPQKYIDRLYKMSLNSPLNISLPGEAKPYIKNTEDKSWSKISLPWISYGYETRITPLQILNFYSAIANDGKMMRPMFIKEVRNRGRLVKTFTPEVINPNVCSKETVAKAKKMMEGVVSNGTAKSLQAADYQIAGKTGTAQMGLVKGKMTYQASFVGYFPADNPKYSCIVVVSSPTGDAYYGGVVAGPVFKDVADKVYSTSLEIHKEINAVQPNYALNAPITKSGYKDDVALILRTLKIPVVINNENSEWVTGVTSATSVNLTTLNMEETLKRGIVPNLIGMAASDVLYLLENKGIRVQLVGRGAVASQSIPTGSTFIKGTQIILQLI